MEYLILYLFMISGNVGGLFAAIGFAAFCAAIGGLMAYSTEGYTWPASLKKCVIIGLSVGCLSALIPSKQDIAMIIAGGVTYQALTSEPAKEIGGKSLMLLNQKLDEYLKDNKEGEK